MARLLPPSDVLAVIRGAFAEPPIAPRRLAMVSDEASSGDRTVLIMPALRPGGCATVKVVTALSGPAAQLSSYLLVFDQRGDLLAIIEAHQLTALRTAAASVLASQCLRAGGARHLAVIGAGRQAYAHVEAYADAFELESITIWARRAAAAEELARFSEGKAGSVHIASSPTQAVRDADIVTCATPSETPLLSGASVRPGTHVDLVGGFRPNMREADDALMKRGTIVVDTEAALIEAGDLLQPLSNGIITREDVLLLPDLLAGTKPARIGDITIFKSVGHAAEDLVTAELLLQRLNSVPAGMQRFPVHG